MLNLDKKRDIALRRKCLKCGGSLTQGISILNALYIEFIFKISMSGIEISLISAI